MSTAAELDRLSQARQQLTSAGQEHVLSHWHQLTSAQQQQLLEQIASVDWPELTRLVASHVKHKPEFSLPQNVAPAPWYPYQPGAALTQKYQQAKALGEKMIRAGQVAAFTVAGGQGTRLGWDGPKGSFPATPVRGVPLFGCLAHYIRKIQQTRHCVVPWYIMTSPINHQDTQRFFQEQNYFGLDAGNVMLFPQAMMPAMALGSGKVLMESPAQIALSPNGHGGSLKALYQSGAIADMKKRGIEQISYTQVDNPIVRVVDPIFLGLHALDDCQMSSKMLLKAYPKEKLGNFCLVDGKMTVIEYSDLPDELAEQRLPNGELRFAAGSIAIHAIRVDFVESLNRGQDIALPFHRAEKKVPYFDLAANKEVNPDKPNAVKLEMFVFDALPLCQRSIVYQTDRADEFAPIKNADGPGAVDCPASSKRTQIERAARWLEGRKVRIARKASGETDAVIEISQLTAIYPEDLQSLALPPAIEPGAQLLL